MIYSIFEHLRSCAGPCGISTFTVGPGGSLGPCRKSIVKMFMDCAMTWNKCISEACSDLLRFVIKMGFVDVDVYCWREYHIGNRMGNVVRDGKAIDLYRTRYPRNSMCLASTSTGHPSHQQ